MDDTDRLTAKEEAIMFLAQELGYVTGLAAGVGELEPVESAMRSALAELNGTELFEQDEEPF